MAVPVAKFTFDPNLLTVNFLDKSENSPTSWSWNFGDSTTSTSQNPVKIYAASGKYTVQLTATNVDGSSNTSYIIIVSTTPVLPLTIIEMVNTKIPTGITVDPNYIINTITKWRLFLQPLLDPAILDSLLFDETAWPSLANLLIADLTARDIILDGSGKSVVGNSQSSGGGINNPIKKIVTGPSEAEWFNSSEFWTDIFKKGGLFDALSFSCCNLASRLRIRLPFCPPLTFSPTIPIKSGRTPVPTPVFPFGNTESL